MKINEIDKKINNIKSWFLVEIKIIDKILARLTNKLKTQINQIINESGDLLANSYKYKEL